MQVLHICAMVIIVEDTEMLHVSVIQFLVALVVFL